MYQSMVDIQPAATEIRRGKKKIEDDRKIEITGQKYNSPLLHRATIIMTQDYMELANLENMLRQTGIYLS